MTKSFFRSMLILSLLYLIIGIVMIIFSDACLQIICYVLGGTAIAFGLFAIISYFSKSSFTHFALALGIAAILIGLLLIIKAKSVMNIISIIIGIALIIDSVLRLQTSLDVKRAGGKIWLFLLICALITLIFGIVLLFYTNAIAIIAGIGLALDGLLILISMISARKLIVE